MNKPSHISARAQAASEEVSSRSLDTYFKNSARLAPPTKQEVRKKRALARVNGLGARYDAWKLKVGGWFDRKDLTPDLAENIGSGRWFRGVGTMVALGAVAIALWPDMTPLEARPSMPTGEEIQDEFRSQMITPLALGADSGRRMGPTQFVTPLESAPERPQIELIATLASGDSLASMLRRAGVSNSDISAVSGLVGSAMSLSEIEPGTKMDIVLGRRAEPGAPRPLDALSFRARFDLELDVVRRGEDKSGPLALQRKAIRVDSTPLRVRGKVGNSLYRSMRSAGVPASAVQDYLRRLNEHIDLDREVQSTDEFDIIIEYQRAATGERKPGRLLYAGIDRDGKPKTQLLGWGTEGRFFEASGVGEQRRGLLAPVNGRQTSPYGMRMHPILGYRRMHSGIDYGAPTGTPIYAVTDGTVISAGRAGGCGITVKLDHGSMQTRYCHMSRMAVSSGQSVRRGQIIGYVGSTGRSTGPHLHYEIYKGGRTVNPNSVSHISRSELSGSELADFRMRLNRLRQIEVGAALADLVPTKTELDEPKREIDKVENARTIR